MSDRQPGEIPRDEETEVLRGISSVEGRRKYLADLFNQNRERLHTMVRLRLDGRLPARLAPSDVLQEAFLDASRRIEEFLSTSPMPLFLWMRRLTKQKLLELLRFHQAARRDARKDVSIEGDLPFHATSTALAKELLSREKAPQAGLARSELRKRLENALEGMSSTDREIVALRHFEELTSAQSAQELGIGESAARKRYFRAMKKLRETLVETGWELGDS